MRFAAILALAATVGLSAAQNGGSDDTGPISNYFPPVCGNSCGPIVMQQKKCGENDPNQIQCICNWDGHEGQARKHIRGCEACIRINRPDNDNLQGKLSNCFSLSLTMRGEASRRLAFFMGRC